MGKKVRVVPNRRIELKVSCVIKNDNSKINEESLKKEDFIESKINNQDENNQNTVISPSAEFLRLIMCGFFCILILCMWLFILKVTHLKYQEFTLYVYKVLSIISCALYEISIILVVLSKTKLFSKWLSKTPAIKIIYGYPFLILGISMILVTFENIRTNSALFIFLTLNMLSCIVVEFSYALTLITDEMFNEKDKNYINTFFSSLTSLVALIISIIALYYTVK